MILFSLTGIFSTPKDTPNKSLYNSNCNLWESCDAVNLTTNFRVGDSSWNETLNRIRYGEETEEDIELLNSRKISNFPDIDFDKALHTFYSNKEVNQHNLKIMSNMNEGLVKIDAEFPNQKRKKTTKHGTIDKTTLAAQLQLKKNANVMLIHNIDITDGLVNGVTGKADLQKNMLVPILIFTVLKSILFYRKSP